MSFKHKLHKIPYWQVFGKFLLTILLWVLPAGLLFLLIFSIYPNYILKGHYIKAFSQTRNLADRITRNVLPQKVDYNTSIILDSTDVVLKEDSGLPPKVFQPLLQAWQPNEVPETAYFTKPVKPGVFHTAMIPDPFTTFAPLPGKIAGLVFHNRQQFRYPVDLVKKKNNEIRIFITGGSVAWGSCATDVEFTIAGSMEKALRKKYPSIDIKVITAAAGAWTTTQERIWIFNRITEYDPDMIISYSGHNDLYANYLDGEDLFDRYSSDGKYFRFAIKGYDYYNRGEAVSTLGYSDTGSRFQSSDFPRKSLKNIKIINSYLKSISIPYVFVLQPAGWVDNKPAYYENYNFLGSEMANQAKHDGYQFIDHSGILKASPKLYVDYIHPGDRGYELIAQDLLARIDLLPVLRKLK